MNLSELKSALRAHPESNVILTLPDGGRVPAHFHITEVGHVSKKFIDCGGTVLTSETCLLQAWQGSNEDDGHRLSAGKLGKILGLAQPILPADDLPVEVEYEDSVIAQYPLEGSRVDGPYLVLALGLKHTDCLARERCGLGAADSEADEPREESAGCCGGPAGGKSCC